MQVFRRKWLFLVVTFFFFGCSAHFFLAEQRTEDSGQKREGKIIKVAAGGDLQKALQTAQAGDIIELESGAIYNSIHLPKKNLTDFITIRTAGSEKFASDFDCYQQDNFAARIVTFGKGVPAVSTEDGANHYRFVCVEFAHLEGGYVYNLVYIGAEAEGEIPHDFEFDRCYFRSSEKGITRRGLAVNGANIVVKRSYFEGFSYPQQETQAIAGWTGTKNIKILDSYIEAGAENILFGGADPARADLIPQDIEVRGNHLKKQTGWKGKATTKFLFELKNAKRVIFAENFLENSWEGSAITITVRNQDGKAPFSVIEDVLITNNVVKNVAEGINILGKDDTFPSQTLKNLSITNNLFLGVGAGGVGRGYFVQVSDGENISITNNTVFNEGNIVTFHGRMPRNFMFHNNIVGHGLYGVHGHPNIGSLKAEFRDNIIVNNRNVGDSDKSFPDGNKWISSYRYAIDSNFRVLPNLKSRNGKPIGFNSDLLPKWLIEKTTKP